MEIEDEGEAAAMAMEMEMQQIHMSSASTTPTGSSYNGHMTNPNSELMRGLNMESMAVGKRAAIAPCTTLVAATNVKYKECLKNHAASIGGHANDGCGEFMPSGEEGTLEALKCAACGCHRNFHRRDTTSSSSSCHHTSEMSSCYFCKRQPVLPLALQAPTPLRMIQHGQQNNHGNFTLGYAPHQHQHQQQYEVDHSSGYGSSGKKRFRTKFTQEQKDKMCAFAEKLGWRIQKHDDVAVQQFCGEVGVKRHVLKVWMHNNKHSLCKKQLTPPHHPQPQPQPHTPSSS